MYDTFVEGFFEINQTGNENGTIDKYLAAVYWVKEEMHYVAKWMKQSSQHTQLKL